MKLISLHIDNFGQFNNFDYVFEDGINQIIEENGWGKSTLAAFIKVMFFGFDNTSKRDDYVNEKRRFKPWQGGLYGGSLAFEIDNKQYTIYRTFEAKDKDDTFKLVDTITKLDSFDYTSDIGKEIFEIDSDSFEKTAYIFQNNCESGSTGDIAALLGCDAVDDVDVNNLDYREMYSSFVVEMESEYPGNCTYSLYDINGDGRKDLLLSYGTCNADYQNIIYTIDENGAISSTSPFYGVYSFYVAEDGNGLYEVYGYMGVEEVRRLTLQGNQAEEELLWSREIGDGEYYENDNPIEYAQGSDLSLLDE